MRESPIEHFHVELFAGDCLRMDDQILTVLEINGDEVTFRIDSVEEFDLDDIEINPEPDNVVCHAEDGKRFPPR